MPKERFQVSKDQGATWKSRWIDRKEFNPENSVLEPGDFIRSPKGIMVVSITNGRLHTEPFQDTKLTEFEYTFGDNKITITASSINEADYLFSQKLLKAGMVTRTEL